MAEKKGFPKLRAIEQILLILTEFKHASNRNNFANTNKQAVI